MRDSRGHWPLTGTPACCLQRSPSQSAIYTRFCCYCCLFLVFSCSFQGKRYKRDASPAASALVLETLQDEQQPLPSCAPWWWVPLSNRRTPFSVWKSPKSQILDQEEAGA